MKTIICPFCGGDKTTEVCHPSWGSRTCPEAYILVPCPTCEGEGEIEVEDDELPNCVWRNADTPFARNH
jgi:hypothetical protein